MTDFFEGMRENIKHIFKALGSFEFILPLTPGILLHEKYEASVFNLNNCNTESVSECR